MRGDVEYISLLPWPVFICLGSSGFLSGSTECSAKPCDGFGLINVPDQLACTSHILERNFS